MTRLTPLVDKTPVIDNYRVALIHIHDGLTPDNLHTIMFLIRDEVSESKRTQISDALDLFHALESVGKLSRERRYYLSELLLEARRVDLMKKLGVTPHELKDVISQNGAHFVNEFRLMLHWISESMIIKDVSRLKFVLASSGISSRSQLEETSNAYAVFILLEQLELLGPKNITYLYNTIQELESKDLHITYLDQYMEKHGLTLIEEPSHCDHSIQCSSLPPPSPAMNSPRSASPSPSSEIGGASILEYPMKGTPRGLCLIINNQNFCPAPNEQSHKALGERHGSSKDSEKLNNVFGMLNFRVKCYDNLKSLEMVQLLKKVARISHSRSDAFVCCILTHGAEGQLYGTDCMPVGISHLLSLVRPSQCKSLENKPKVFFIQACQGELYDDAASLYTSLPSIDGASNYRSLEEELASFSSHRPSEDVMECDNGSTDKPKLHSVTLKYPRQPDYLIGLATVPGYVSYRSKSSGTWYIDALCESLHEYHNKEDLLSILTIVNSKVSKQCKVLSRQEHGAGRHARQIPLPCSTLTKKLYLRTDRK